MTGAANAASSPSRSQARATVTAPAGHTKPAIVGVGDVGCDFGAVTPYQIVSGGTVYGQAVTTYCTDPPPVDCKMSAQMFKQTPAGSGLWLEVASTAPGWTTNCNIKITMFYKCVGAIEKSAFYTQAQLIVMDEYGDTGSADTPPSPTSTMYCD
jgi:hypothetical protein